MQRNASRFHSTERNATCVHIFDELMTFPHRIRMLEDSTRSQPTVLLCDVYSIHSIHCILCAVWIECVTVEPRMQDHIDFAV